MACRVTGCEAYPAQKKAWERFGNTIGASLIKYKDLGKGERYEVTLSSGETMTLVAAGNQYDGGFLNLEFPRDNMPEEAING